MASIEIRPSQFEVRWGDALDGKTFQGVKMLYLDHDSRSVRAAMARGDEGMFSTVRKLSKLMASRGFQKAIFSHNGKLVEIDLTQERWGYNPDGDLFVMLID